MKFYGDERRIDTENYITELGTVSPVDTNRDVAERYLMLKMLSEKIDAQMVALKPKLVRVKINEFFTELGKKVQMTEGRTSSFWDIKGLWDDFVKKGKFNEFYKIVSISEKEIKEYPDGELLKALYKKEGETGEPSIKASDMTKEELRKSLAE